MNLTIVIVSFNSGDILHRCIKSIDNKYQIIVVENSIDNNLKLELEILIWQKPYYLIKFNAFKLGGNYETWINDNTHARLYSCCISFNN